VAAELWGISVEEVANRARLGSIASKTDLGFLVVDVGFEKPLRTGCSAPTYRQISHTKKSPQTFCTNAQTPDWRMRRELVAKTRRRVDGRSILQGA
jgi:hypothetical protein